MAGGACMLPFPQGFFWKTPCNLYVNREHSANLLYVTPPQRQISSLHYHSQHGISCKHPSDHHEAFLINFQKWSRLVRFIAEEDSREHIGEPVDPDVDGELLRLQRLTASVVMLRGSYFYSWRSLGSIHPGSGSCVHGHFSPRYLGGANIKSTQRSKTSTAIDSQRNWDHSLYRSQLP